MTQRDLFGEQVKPSGNSGARTERERKREQRRRYSRPRGHAWPPGTGPKGETCGSCKYICRLKPGSRAFFKCYLVKDRWTASAKTDVRYRDPACEKWKALDAHE